MASSSSLAAVNKPSTSASSGISPDEENTNPTQNPVTGTENEVSKSLPQDQNKKKDSFFSNPFKPKKAKTKILPKPTKENVEKGVSKSLPQDQNKKEENVPYPDEEIKTISKLIEADFHTIETAMERIDTNKGVLLDVHKLFAELKKDLKNDKLLEDAEKKLSRLTTAPSAKDFREFKNVVKALKQHVLKGKKEHDIQDEKGDFLSRLNAILNAHKQVATKDQLEMMPNFFADPNFEKTLQFKDFKAQYDELSLELKLCLLCFSVFPENVDIKRRVLVYWWMGEGFVSEEKKNTPQEKTDTLEHRAHHYFETLLNMGFIESAEKKPNSKADVVRMHPFVRSMLNRIAQKAEFFEFDGEGNVNEKYSKSLRACLLNGTTLTLTEDDKAVDKDEKAKLNKANDRLLENIHAIINVDEAILNFKHSSLSKMRHANMLYIGRWQNSGTHHIEVDDTKILDAKKGNLLDGLQHIRYLKFLSLQGISRITKLPESILKLQNLTILDIRACHNLEIIPNDIGCLVNLTHLDMSECYLLDEMPKGISKLTKLQVLNGFVVLESANKKTCTLVDLKGFDNLRTLSINTGSDTFPSVEDLNALKQFKNLTKLAIAWGRGSVTKISGQENSGEIPKEPDTGDQAKEQIPEKENSGEITKEPDTSNQDNDQISEKENLGEVTKEPDTGDQDNDQTPKKDNSGEIAKEEDASNQNNEQTSKKENSGEIIREADMSNQKIDQISKKVNPGEITKKTETLNQDDDLTSKKENTREITKKADTGNKDNDQNLKKDNQVGKKNGKALQNQDLEKNREKSASQEESPKKNKGLLDRGLKTLFSKSKTPTKVVDVDEALSKLTKLDLQCLPEITHNWLMPEKLSGLKKFYIRGGKLSDLGQFHKLDEIPGIKKWENVTELRLKYLNEVEMEWGELLELFPKLEYLEKVDCPKLSFFPCNEIGVWKKKIS